MPKSPSREPKAVPQRLPFRAKLPIYGAQVAPRECGEPASCKKRRHVATERQPRRFTRACFWQSGPASGPTRFTRQCYWQSVVVLRPCRFMRDARRPSLPVILSGDARRPSLPVILSGDAKRRSRRIYRSHARPASVPPRSMSGLQLPEHSLSARHLARIPRPNCGVPRPRNFFWQTATRPRIISSVLPGSCRSIVMPVKASPECTRQEARGQPRRR